MTILIIHGIMGHAGMHWQQWLHDELVKKGHQVIMPNLPGADYPTRGEWLRILQELTHDIDKANLVIVGHSLGVTAALDLIENYQTPIKTLISVSGMADDYGAELNSYYLKERSIDFAKVHKNLQKSFVVYGENDPYVPQETLSLLARKLHVIPKVIQNGGHLNTDAGYTQFPLLLNIIENLNTPE